MSFLESLGELSKLILLLEGTEAWLMLAGHLQTGHLTTLQAAATSPRLLERLRAQRRTRKR